MNEDSCYSEEPAPRFAIGSVSDLRGLVAKAGQHLACAGVPNAWHDARRLAMWAACCNDVDLMAHADKIFADPDFTERYVRGVRLRAQRVPLQHIEGRVQFLDFEVEVGPGVLIPRPETEVTALCALSFAHPGTRALDCGTGTGVLAIALARATRDVEIHATERAAPALIWAARNIGRLAPDVELHESWYCGVDGDFDLIVANPPYVGAAEWELLEPEVRKHDPRTALVPSDGEAITDVLLIVKEASERLRPRGALICEIGVTQARDAVNAAYMAGLCDVEIEEDLSGRSRVLVACKP